MRERDDKEMRETSLDLPQSKQRIVVIVILAVFFLFFLIVELFFLLFALRGIARVRSASRLRISLLLLLLSKDHQEPHLSAENLA